MIESVIVGGQTGVDQGAAEGAKAAGMRVTGFRPAVTRQQTESGEMPAWLAEALTPLAMGGYRERTIHNVREADALLVIVPNRLRPCDTAGTALTIDFARKGGLQIWVCDGRGDIECQFVTAWLARLQPVYGAMRLMVAGPRGSSWPEGFEVASRFVKNLFDRQTRIKGT